MDVIIMPAVREVHERILAGDRRRAQSPTVSISLGEIGRRAAEVQYTNFRGTNLNSETQLTSPHSPAYHDTASDHNSGGSEIEVVISPG